MAERLCLGKRVWVFIKNHQQWLGFIVLIVALLYSYITVLFEPKELLLDIIFGALFLLLIFGMIHAFKIEKEEVKKTVHFDNLDGLFVILGVMATYTVVHFFGISVVLASCSIGLLGHFIIKKFEVAIYCGSFAGMVSVVMFNFYEVLALAFICAFIYILTKPIFSGYGGKLGTVAFMSSLIVHSLFGDEFLVVASNIHLGFLLATTIIGVTVTFYIQHKLKVTAVFASAVTSFVFTLVLVLFFSEHLVYAVVFFSASFIGMSSKEKLPNIVFVVISGAILGAVYYIFIHFFNGLGGKLGLMALISVVITSGISKIFARIETQISKS
ncbi:hypothetical protein RJI07_03185 [Mycoplasmatota bacterium WC30]